MHTIGSPHVYTLPFTKKYSLPNSLVTCFRRTDATVKQFLAFRLGEVTADSAELASELRAVKVSTSVVS